MGTHRKPSLARDRQIPSGPISEGNHESEHTERMSGLPDRPTYLTHDVFIVRQRQSEVCDVSIIALVGQRESPGAGGQSSSLWGPPPSRATGHKDGRGCGLRAGAGVGGVSVSGEATQPVARPWPH